MMEQIDWQAKQPAQVACVSEDLKYFGDSGTTCRHKANDMKTSITWRREAQKEKELDDVV